MGKKWTREFLRRVYEPFLTVGAINGVRVGVKDALDIAVMGSGFKRGTLWQSTDPRSPEEFGYLCGMTVNLCRWMKPGDARVYWADATGSFSGCVHGAVTFLRHEDCTDPVCVVEAVLSG